MAIIKTINNGNIWDTQKEIIVITTNCEGVCGAGIAEQVRIRWPHVEAQYRKFAKAGFLAPGKLWLVQADPNQKLLMFPTKVEWRNPSKMEYVKAGLEKLRDICDDKEIYELAMPMLGCSNGKLDRREVEALIRDVLQPTTLEIELYR